MELKCKVSLIGNEKVGKTSLIFRYIQNTFSSDYKTTLGADFIEKQYSSKEFPEFFNGNDCLYTTIWDLTGQSMFNEITSLYIQGSIGIILVFDVNNAESFNSLHRWKKLADSVCTNPIYLAIGNKCDLEKCITDEDINKMEQDLGIPIVLGSAKISLNVSDVFEKMARLLIERYKNTLIQEKTKKKK